MFSDLPEGYFWEKGPYLTFILNDEFRISSRLSFSVFFYAFR